MKILLVITKAEIGGAQSFVLTLARGIKDSGHEVVLAYGESGYLIDELDEVGVKSYQLKSLKRSKNVFKIFSYIYELKSLLNKEKIDVVHLNSSNALPGVISAKLISRKIKTVFTVHGLSILDKNYKASRVIKFLYKTYFKFFLKFVNKIVFVSKYNKTEALNNNLVKRGEVIYNSFKERENYFLSKEEARLELSRRINQGLSDVYLIGSIGRLAYAKNYSFLIDNWDKIKNLKEDAKLIVIGEGEKREELIEMITKYNLEKDIYLVGEIKEASRLLKSFDLFILPSLYEGLSISLIEAQFANIPVLASDVGGNGEVVGSKNCFDINGIEDLLNKLEQGVVYKDKKNMFEVNKMVKKYLQTYEI